MPQEIYDAVVVGSGANGGWAAKELCEAGMQVAMLEAGQKLDPETDFSEHVLPHHLPLRGRTPPNHEALERRPIGRRCYACGQTNAHFFIDEVDNPYTFPKEKPFWWIRSNMVGGRSILWGRQSYRFSDWDFKAASHDGFGDDWPISYADLEPYYEKVERYVGISGQREGYEQLPDSYFMPPMKMSCGELRVKETVNKMGRGFTIGRVAVNTRMHRGRAACHYCGPCHRGCSTNSYFNSPTTTLPDAAATGKFTLITNAIAHTVTTDDRGLAKSVIYYDKHTKVAHELKAKVIVLCASTLESTRILFNSATDRFPNGLANSSDHLGHYVMDHIYATGASGSFPDLGRSPEVASRPNGIYIPRFRNLLGDKQKNFIRGYGYQGGEGLTSYEHAYTQKGYGKKFKESVHDGNTSSFRLSGFGEMLPRWENRAFIDPEVTDAWGIPVIRVECELGDNEKAMIQDIVEQGAEMLEAAGAKNVSVNTNPAPPGFGIHETGTARMGNDPKTSVLNKWNQAHDVKNLFVMDGSSFVSIACQNPTLTMMALTVRASEYLLDEYRRGNLS